MRSSEFAANAKNKAYGKGFNPKDIEGEKDIEGDYGKLSFSKGVWRFSYAYQTFLDDGLEYIMSHVRLSENNRLRWYMNTNSKITSKRIPSEEIHEMLIYAMLDVDAKRSFLLPKISRKGELTYMCNIVGDHRSFEGLEKILSKGRSVYNGKIVGGAVPYSEKNSRLQKRKV